MINKYVGRGGGVFQHGTGSSTSLSDAVGVSVGST